jgi:HlyD family secretion protein
MKQFNKIWKGVAVVILLASCSGTGTKSTPTLVPTPVTAEKPTYSVQRGVVTRTAQLNGRVTPMQQQDLFFRSDGFVKEVLVQIGDTVQEGDVLARLDEPERYQAGVAEAELAYAQAQLKLEQSQLDAPIQLAEAKIVLQKNSTELANAKYAVSALNHPHVIDALTLEKYRTDSALAQQNLTVAQSHYDELSSRPETDMERANALNTLIEARRAYFLATINLNWVQGKTDQAEIDLAQIHLDLAQANYNKAAAEVERWQVDNPTGEVSLVKLALANAEASLAVAQKAQKAVELRAPFTGQVLSSGIAPGSSVKAFQTVLTLADPTRLEIRAVPTAEDLSLLGIGQVAVVRLSSQQGQDLLAKITNLPLTVSSTTEVGSQDSTVHFSLDDSTIPLTLGDAATILVTIDMRENALWLPPAAIQTFQGKDFVYVMSNGVQRRANVTLGLKSADRIEILSGLDEGQTVTGQ